MEDPTLLAVQTSRRLPRPLRDQLARATGWFPKSSTTRAFLEFASDKPQAARRTLEELARGRTPRTTLEKELRAQLSLPAEDEHSDAAARAAWFAGDLDRARTLSSARLGMRYRGEAQVLTPGSGMVLPPHPVTPPPYGPLRVFHFLTNSLPWTRSGYTVRTQALLEAEQGAGIVVGAATRLAYPTLIGRPWAGKEEVVGGIRYHRLQPRTLPRTVDRRLLLQARMLAEEVAKFRPHVLHTTTNYENALTVDAVSRATGIPWVYEMRGNMEESWLARQPEELRTYRRNSQRFSLMRQRETEMALRADRVVVLSNVQKKDLVSRGVPGGKITIAPNSVEDVLVEVERNPRAARERLGLPDGFWVGTVTAVVDYEGLPTLLEAAAALARIGLPVNVAIVGDGVALPALKDLAEELGVFDRVVFPGRVDAEEALDWYQALDAFVVPRVDTQVTRNVTPIKGMQARALGVPLIVSDLPALREAYCADGAAIPVPAGDADALAAALKATWAEPLEAENRAAAARSSTSTWTRVAGRIRDEVYEPLAHRL